MSAYVSAIANITVNSEVYCEGTKWAEGQLSEVYVTQQMNEVRQSLCSDAHLSCPVIRMCSVCFRASRMELYRGSCDKQKSMHLVCTPSVHRSASKHEHACFCCKQTGSDIRHIASAACRPLVISASRPQTASTSPARPQCGMPVLAFAGSRLSPTAASTMPAGTLRLCRCSMLYRSFECGHVLVN